VFEVIVSLCLMASPGVCRDHLLPGLETKTLTECQSELAGAAAELDTKSEKTVRVGSPVCRAMPAGLTLEPIADDIFVHMGAIAEPGPDNLGDVANIGVVIGDRSIAVIDAGGSRAVGEDLYRAIRARSDLPVSHLILTHMHPDHVLGASVFAEAGADIVGHPHLARALLDRKQSYLDGFSALIGKEGFLGTEVVLPGQSSLPERIDLGGRSLLLKTWPTAHTATDLTVFDEKTRTFFAGDLVFDRHTPALDGSITGWRKVLDDIAALDIRKLVPGHGGPVLKNPDGLAPLQHYLQVLEEDTRRSLAEGMRIGEAAGQSGQSEAGKWELFDLFNTRNATAAYTELEWE
jgi:quinoprotein relay system zinc metallohydrolase 2